MSPEYFAYTLTHLPQDKQRSSMIKKRKENNWPPDGSCYDLQILFFTSGTNSSILILTKTKRAKNINWATVGLALLWTQGALPLLVCQCIFHARQRRKSVQTMIEEATTNSTIMADGVPVGVCGGMTPQHSCRGFKCAFVLRAGLSFCKLRFWRELRKGGDLCC